MNCPHCSKVIVIKIVKDTGNGVSTSDRSTDVGELLSQIHDDELETDFEIDFIKQTRERFAQYQDRIRMSEKQLACLQKIAAKVAD